jgi:hypothetical protein
LELAQLAARLAAGRRQFDPAQLTADARALYLAAAGAVRNWSEEGTMLEAGLRARFEAAEAAGFSSTFALTRPDEPWTQWPADMPRPAKFPATREQFLRRVVGGKTKADRLGRYRAFLRWYRAKHGGAKLQEEDERGAVGDLLSKHGKAVWTAELWLQVAEHVFEWKREQASEHGRKGAEGLKAKRVAGKKA